MAVLASMKPAINEIPTATATQNSARTHRSATARGRAARADGCMATRAGAALTLDYGNVRSSVVVNRPVRGPGRCFVALAVPHRGRAAR